MIKSINKENDLVIVFENYIFKIKTDNLNDLSSKEFKFRIQHALIFKDTNIVLTNFDGEILFFNMIIFEEEGNRQSIHESKGDGPLNCIVASKDYIVAGGNDNNIKFFDCARSNLKNQNAHINGFSTISISSNQHFIASAGNDKYVIIWIKDKGSLAPVFKMKFTASPALLMEFSYCSDSLLLKLKNKIKIVDLLENKLEEITDSSIEKLIGKFPKLSLFMLQNK